jgi:hypothetical protein
VKRLALVAAVLTLLGYLGMLVAFAYSFDGFNWSDR